MNHVVTFMIAGDWVAKHRNDETMPIENVKQFATELLVDKIEVIDSTINSIVLKLIDGVTVEEISNELCDFLEETYSDFNRDSLIYEQSVGKGTDRHDDKPAPDSVKDDLSRRFAELFNIEGPVREEKRDDSQNVLAEIDKIISGEQFKTFAHEVALVAPQLKANKTQGIFLRQWYLYSINEGCGLEKYLDFYVKLVNELDIGSLYHDVSYYKLKTPKPNREDPRMELLDDIGRHNSDTVICIDISNWMNDVNGVEFREFLSLLKAQCHDAVVVFRIPYVDKEVMDNVGRALNDMLFLRALSFPPYTSEEVGQFAVVKLNKYGFSMADDAWKGFYNRIREESSDGRFYGVDTVEKVVGELLYKKQLSNAMSNTDDKVVRKEDTDKLCLVDFVDNITGLEMLDRMVGTEGIKTRILEIISQIELARSTPTMAKPCLHMRFVGNPGTGKTTVARIIGKILKEKNILRVGEFFEHAGRDFCGKYIGETAPKTLTMCREAYGSVLFIDEAYSLFKGEDDSRDYGREALDTLIAEMENHRNDMVIVMAGYTDEMNRLLKGNAGLASRMPYTIEFPNFTKQQLYDIFCSMSRSKLPCSDEVYAEAKEYFDNIDDSVINSKEFSNARYVRNLYERVCAKAAMRCQIAGEKTVTLTKEDFVSSISDHEFALNKKKPRSRIGFGN